jgi:hypothetical protein
MDIVKISLRIEKPWWFGLAIFAGQAWAKLRLPMDAAAFSQWLFGSVRVRIKEV